MEHNDNLCHIFLTHAFLPDQYLFLHQDPYSTCWEIAENVKEWHNLAILRKVMGNDWSPPSTWHALAPSLHQVCCTRNQNSAKSWLLINEQTDTSENLLLGGGNDYDPLGKHKYEKVVLVFATLFRKEIMMLLKLCYLAVNSSNIKSSDGENTLSSSVLFCILL